ncbi:type I restriction modification DNA specificity domain protein [Candidatus Magnetomorum sp. HK-1]|nr:type I restriction modification DNA specificity domain protein [Candidatus Magnetomorum sp. HK-1]
MSKKKRTLKAGNANLQELIPKLRFPEFRDAGAWEKKPISKLLTIGSGKDYRHLSNGDIPVYGSGGYMLSVDDYLCDGESVCIGRKGTIDKPLFLKDKFWTVDTLFYTHSFKACLPIFIYLTFQNINWLNYNEAGGIPSLSKTTIGKIKIPIPLRHEQRKIADCLSSIDKLITAQTQKIETLKAHKKGLMQQLFPAQGETVPKLRFPEFRDAGAWEEKPLRDISFSISSGKDKKSYSGKYDLFGSTGIIGATSTASFDGKYILVARVGANAGLLTKVNAKFGVTDNTLVICLHQTVNIEFIFSSLERFGLNKLIFGSGQPLITGRQLKDVSLRLPDGAEQQKIADCLSSFDKLITAQAHKLDSLKSHKKGLMQQLFPSTEEVNE